MGTVRGLQFRFFGSCRIKQKNIIKTKRPV